MPPVGHQRSVRRVHKEYKTHTGCTQPIYPHPSAWSKWKTEDGELATQHARTHSGKSAPGVSVCHDSGNLNFVSAEASRGSSFALDIVLVLRCSWSAANRGSSLLAPILCARLGGRYGDAVTRNVVNSTRMLLRRTAMSTTTRA